MRVFRLAAQLVAGVLFCAGSVSAQTNPVQGLVDFADIARTSAITPVYRFDNECPEAGEHCKTRQTLPSGVIVMISDPGGEGGAPPAFVRFVYTPDGSRASVTGSVRRSALRAHELPAPKASQWLGRYRTVVDASQDITAGLTVQAGSGGSIRVSGSAIRGASEDDERPDGAPALDFDASMTPDGNRGMVRVDATCSLKLALLGPYIAVEEDGDSCSVVGAPSFSGLYLREGAVAR